MLIAPIRKVVRLKDLQIFELNEMMKLASLISQKIANGMCDIAIQDGPDAGQTVLHVHIHVIPRAGEAVLHIDRLNGDRTRDEMASEADSLRQILQET